MLFFIICAILGKYGEIKLKKFYSIIFLIIFSSDIYAATLMEKLNMPSDKLYLSHLNISFDLLQKNNSAQIETSPNLQQTKSKEKNRFILKGIVKLNNKFFAIVNGETITVGDKIADYTIKKIDINQIELLSEKNRERLIVKIEK